MNPAGVGTKNKRCDHSNDERKRTHHGVSLREWADNPYRSQLLLASCVEGILPEKNPCHSMQSIGGGMILRPLRNFAMGRRLFFEPFRTSQFFAHFFAMNNRPPHRRTFPPLLTPEHLTSPLNASPYPVSLHDFSVLVAGWPGRATHGSRLLEEMGKARPVIVEAVLLGGSFMDDAVALPKDVDTVWFYRAGPIPPEGQWLADEQRRLKSQGIDARFVPVDGRPDVLIRATSFFTLIYSKRKDSAEISRGMLLLIPDTLSPSDNGESG